MTWAEASRLTKILMKDPASTIAAATAGWQHTASREWQVFADLRDLVAQAHFQNADQLRLPRPWEAPAPKPTAMPRETLDAILARQRALPPQQQQGRNLVAGDN